MSTDVDFLKIVSQVTKIAIRLTCEQRSLSMSVYTPEEILSGIIFRNIQNYFLRHICTGLLYEIGSTIQIGKENGIVLFMNRILCCYRNSRIKFGTLNLTVNATMFQKFLEKFALYCLKLYFRELYVILFLQVLLML